MSKKSSNGCFGCLGTLLVYGFLFVGIGGCTNYFDYHYNHRVEITARAFITYGFFFHQDQATSIGITEGDTLHFLNKTSEPVLICIGYYGNCTTYNVDAQGPRELYAPGQQIRPGQIADVHFANAGTYVITTDTLPHLQFTVNVQEKSSD